MWGHCPSPQPVKPTVQIQGNHGRRLVHWLTYCQLVILPAIFDKTDDPVARKRNRYKTYASKFLLSNGYNYNGQKIMRSLPSALQHPDMQTKWW